MWHVENTLDMDSWLHMPPHLSRLVDMATLIAGK